MDGLFLVKKHLLRHFGETLDSGGCGNDIVRKIEAAITEHQLLNGINGIDADMWMKSVHKTLQEDPVRAGERGAASCCEFMCVMSSPLNHASTHPIIR